jgi:hypothetical protein
MNFPLLLFLAALCLLALATRAGDAMRKRVGDTKGGKSDSRPDAALLLSASLTLLYFIIGFSFSMAISRYDLRKNCEQAEAIAIGTEYSRADLLSAADSAKLRVQLKAYLDQRVLYYTTRSASRASEITNYTDNLQADLWSNLRSAIVAVPPPLMGLLVTGMNDVVNSERSSEAAWLNRIPLAAWALMAIIGMGCCWVIGYRARGTDWFAFMIVPFSAAVSFFLIADLDSPRGGSIRITPQNLTRLSQILAAQTAQQAGGLRPGIHSTASLLGKSQWLEGKIPGGVPGIFPFVRHGDHVIVDHVAPLACCARFRVPVETRTKTRENPLRAAHHNLASHANYTVLSLPDASLMFAGERAAAVAIPKGG